MPERRELKLVQQAYPCDTNYFDRTLLTISQVKSKGREVCPNFSICRKTPGNCAHRYGTLVAGYVMQGGDLKSELLDFAAEAPDLNGEYWDSQDRAAFELIRGKARIIRAVERFTRIVLLEDPDKSVFDACSKCNGIKLTKVVVDSGRDGVGPLSGSGRTRRRNAVYCPSCDPEPRNGTFEEGTIEDLI